MIEKVAKAIYERAFDSSWDEAWATERELYLDVAQAAIDAVADHQRVNGRKTSGCNLEGRFEVSSRDGKAE